MIGYNALQVIELIGNVASFRGFWNVLDVYFIPGNYLYQIYSEYFVIMHLNNYFRLHVRLSFH